MSEMIDQYLDELETSKEDIKQSLINKGVTPTGGLTSYAEAVDSIKSNLGTATVSITKNGTQTITAEEYGYDGMSKVDVTVQVATGGGDKPQIFNGFRFTGGDISRVDFSQYDWSSVYDTSYFFQGCTHSTGDWSNFEENFNGEILSGYYMFQNFLGTSIPNIDYPIRLAECMFGGCRNLTTIPQLDTSKVTDMSYMFQNCEALTSVPQLDTSNVTNMKYMFQNCRVLTSIPQLDTSKVTNMSYMFDTSYSTGNKLTAIPQLDTSKVTDMNSMFRNCQVLTSIPQLDTSKVTNMKSMFSTCKQLIAIPQLDTSNVTDMSYMFYDCRALAELPDFNSVKVQNFGPSFSSTWLYGCTKLQKLGVVDCDRVTNIGYFFGDNSRTYLTDFGGCRNLGKASSVSNTNSYFMIYAPNLNYQSVLNVLNGLYDRASAGLSVLTLKLHANHLAMLSEDDIAIATNKGWTIV